MLKPDIRSS